VTKTDRAASSQRTSGTSRDGSTDIPPPDASAKDPSGAIALAWQESQEQLRFARSVLRAEAEAIERIPLDARFESAVSLLLKIGSTARPAASLVVSGLGKSGLIGRKLAATFASTGTPCHFMHPVEAMHGDLGSVKRGDAVLLLSYSGRSEEIVGLAEVLQQDGAPTLAIVGPDGTPLTRLVEVALPIGDVTEACPHNLAPTASTTAMLSLGDALAMAVSRRRSFGPDDFHKFHPGGGLGKQLLPVRAAMRFKAGENLPLIPEGVSVVEAFDLARPRDKTLRRAGAILVVDEAGRLAGLFTDGDLRRLIFERKSDVERTRIGEVMTRTPTTLSQEAKVRDAVHVIREKRIDELPIVDEAGRPVGLIDVQDLVALKVIEG